MSETPHTPGPWGIERARDSDSVLIYQHGSDGMGVVAAVWPHPFKGVTAANARLIAAAPELLAALRELCRAWHARQLPVSDRMDAALSDAEAVIAKAEGRP